MSIEINELLNQCKEKLERNLVSSALQQLYDAYYLEDISKSEDIKLMRTRLLGHLGEYSEVFRSINEIRFEPGTSTTYHSYATIWAGVYWSRLGESEKALKIFESIQPPTDPEYLVLHWGHLLTIAIELGDKDLGETILKKTDRYKKKVKSSEIDWKELSIWEYILSPISKGKVTKDTVDKIVSKVYELKNSMDKKSFDSYIDLRIGNLYDYFKENDLAKKYYNEARRKALEGYNGVAILMSNTAILNLMEKTGEKFSNDKIWRKTLRETSVIAGQHGIGLIPCNLSKTLWKRVNELDNEEKLICRSWILSERYLPNITRLEGDAFEQLCKQVLSDHALDIIGIHVNVVFSSADQKAYDILLSSSIKIPFKYAVQCKGGRSRKNWTENALKKELSKELGDSIFQENLNDLKDEGFTGYIFMCSTRVSEDGKKWLDKIHEKIFASKCIVIDSMVIENYLIENPKLRITVSMAISGI